MKVDFLMKLYTPQSVTLNKYLFSTTAKRVGPAAGLCSQGWL